MLTWIKAKFFLLAVALVWASLIIQLFPLQITLLIYCAINGNQNWKAWQYSVWMMQDQTVNVILSGYHETTVSSKVGWMATNGSQTALKMEEVINWLFLNLAGQPNHCRHAIESTDKHRYDAHRALIGLAGYVTSYLAFIAIAHHTALYFGA